MGAISVIVLSRDLQARRSCRRPDRRLLSQICHGAAETARNWAGAVGMAMRRKPYAISFFSTARDRPGPLAESSNPAGATKIVFIP